MYDREGPNINIQSKMIPRRGASLHKTGAEELAENVFDSEGDCGCEERNVLEWGGVFDIARHLIDDHDGPTEI